MEKRKIINSIFIPFLLVFLLWVIKITETLLDIDLGFLGVYPLKASGLIGIVTSPLIHSGFSHLIANSIPLLVLGTALFYFYREISVKVFLLLYLVTGLWVWVFAREAYHIGASGVVYGLASFIFMSGIIRKNTSLMALAMIVAFLYGGLVWGVFPEYFPEQNISWESHLMGIVAGTVLAIFYRKEGPQKKVYTWDDEEDEENDDEDNAYWKTTITQDEINSIKRTFTWRR